MHVLVTGAAGFLGRRVVRRLADTGHDVRALARRQPSPGLFGNDVDVVRGDVTDLASLAHAMQGVTAVVHLATVLIERGWQTYDRVNVQGSRNVLSAAEAARASHFVHMSVVDAQPNPRYRYLLSRWAAEQAVQSARVPWTIVRASLLWGEGDAFFSVFAKYMRLPSPLFPIIGDGKARFHPMSADELAQCIVDVVQKGSAVQGGFFDLGGPEVLTYEQMVDTVMSVIGVRRAKVHVPVPLVKPGAWLMERLMPRPLLTPEQLRLLEVDSIGEMGAVERDFGFAPTALQEGLAYLRERR
jgi:NADH dehydrogenase